MKKQIVALLLFSALVGTVFAQETTFTKKIVGTWDIKSKRDLLPGTVTFNRDFSGIMVFSTNGKEIKIPFEWSKKGEQIPLKYDTAITPGFTVGFSIYSGNLYGDANFDGGGGYQTQYLRAKSD